MKPPSAPFLERTFQLVPRVGPWRERDLYAQNIETWAQFEAQAAIRTVMSEAIDADLLNKIGELRAAVAEGSLARVAESVRAAEHWRAYSAFGDQTLFLDIEADGDSEPTVVGIFDRHGVASFRRDTNLAELPQRMADSRIWVTFNGGSYDLPILRQTFENLPQPLMHLDLKVLARRTGLTGGLKSIEEKLGLTRPPHLKGLKGLDAIRMWKMWTHQRDVKALRILTEYNLYDAINLRSILEWCQWRIAETYQWQVERQPIFERGDVLYDVSQLLLKL